jgi:hypothetical protein
MVTITKKKFHQFTNYRKNLNSIWEINDEEGNMASSFKDKAELGVSYLTKILMPLLNTLFRAPTKVWSKGGPLYQS